MLMFDFMTQSSFQKKPNLGLLEKKDSRNMRVMFCFK